MRDPSQCAHCEQGCLPPPAAAALYAGQIGHAPGDAGGEELTEARLAADQRGGGHHLRLSRAHRRRGRAEPIPGHRLHHRSLHVLPTAGFSRHGPRVPAAWEGAIQVMGVKTRGGEQPLRTIFV
jgi:hypothetical protein